MYFTGPELILQSTSTFQIEISSQRNLYATIVTVTIIPPPYYEPDIVKDEICYKLEAICESIK